jgi:hypothetical protein
MHPKLVGNIAALKMWLRDLRVVNNDDTKQFIGETATVTRVSLAVVGPQMIVARKVSGHQRRRFIAIGCDQNRFNYLVQRKKRQHIHRMVGLV